MKLLAYSQFNETKESFETWFKNSKIKYANKPLICYHGTDNKFTEFSKNMIGNTDAGYYGSGIYFTPDIESAKTYGKNIISVYLKCENPFPLSLDWYIARKQLYDLFGYEYLNPIKTLTSDIKIKYIKDVFSGLIKPQLYNKAGTLDNIDGQHISDNDLSHWHNNSKELTNGDALLIHTIGINDLINSSYVPYPTRALITDIGSDELTEKCIESGYDGIIVYTKQLKHTPENIAEIIVFEPSQIKFVNDINK